MLLLSVIPSATKQVITNFVEGIAWCSPTCYVLEDVYIFYTKKILQSKVNTFGLLSAIFNSVSLKQPISEGRRQSRNS